MEVWSFDSRLFVCGRSWYGCLGKRTKTAPIIEASDKASLAFSKRFSNATSTNDTGRRDTFGELKRHWSVGGRGEAESEVEQSIKGSIALLVGRRGGGNGDGLVCHGFRSAVSSA